MHIPDNYLSPATCAVLTAAMVPVWALSVGRVRKEISKERIPLLGVAAAYSFVLMMFNVPLPGGSTGHAVGGTLVAVLLGPWAACIAVTVALLIQALFFGDGGILAFGANCFNMAFVLPFVGYYAYAAIKARWRSQSGRYVGLALASYLGLNMAALCAAIEFGLQPALFRDASGLPMYCPYPLAVSVPAMLLPHLAVAGMVEAAFTLAIVAFIQKASPGLLRDDPKAGQRPLLALLGVLAALSPLGLLAAGTAWGEWGVEEISAVETGGKALGFVPTGMKDGFSLAALMPDYAVKGLPAIAGYLLSAIAGGAVLIIVFKLLSLLGSKPAARKEG